jgi:hypothetical protein
LNKNGIIVKTKINKNRAYLQFKFEEFGWRLQKFYTSEIPPPPFRASLNTHNLPKRILEQQYLLTFRDEDTKLKTAISVHL